jgi:hypothetical protein
MFWSLVGAAAGWLWGEKVNPVKLGLRTAIAVSIVKFGLNISGVFG